MALPGSTTRPARVQRQWGLRRQQHCHGHQCRQRHRGGQLISIGTNARAAANNSTALGKGARVASSHENSTAVGHGAVPEFDNEVSLGAKNGSSTYTTPGITSDLSRARQSGPLEVVTSDSNGHLASDGGQIFRELGEQGAGIAIALALENPTWSAMRVWHVGESRLLRGQHRSRRRADGRAGHNFVGEGERWALSGGVGLSLNENNFGGQNTDRTVAGRAGVQVSW